MDKQEFTRLLEEERRAEELRQKAELELLDDSRDMREFVQPCPFIGCCRMRWSHVFVSIWATRRESANGRRHSAIGVDCYMFERVHHEVGR